MAELTISPEEIRSALDEFVSSYQPAAASMTEVGVVVTSGDGIARVEGLPSAMANELLRFENGTMGIALNLDEREIGVVVLGDSEGIDEGSTVHGTGEVLSVPVGDGYLGRVVDAMGDPIDGIAHGIDNAPKVAVADRHGEHLTCSMHGRTLIDAFGVSQHNSANLALVEVEGNAHGAVLKAQQLIRHRRG